jgi:hypothetical protein
VTAATELEMTLGHWALVDDIATIEFVIIQRSGRDNAFFPTSSHELRAGISEIGGSIPCRNNSAQFAIVS